MLFIFLTPFLVGYILNRKLEFNYSMQWLAGLLTISVLLMTMHGYGLSKDNTFNIIYFLSVIGFLLCVKDFFKTSIHHHTSRINTYISDLSFSDILFLVVVLIFLAEAVVSVIRNPLEAGDALAYWYRKAKFLYLWEELRFFPTISYPNLGSSIWMLGMNFYNGLEIMGRVLFPIITSIIFISKWRLLKVKYVVNRRELLLLSLLFSYYFIYIMTSKFGGFYYIYSGYVDWMVGIFPAMAYIFLIVNIFPDIKNSERENPYQFNLKRVSFLFFIISCASIIKMEGYVFTIIYIFSYLLTLLLVNKKYIINNKLKIVVAILLALFVSTLYRQILAYNGIEFIAAQSFSLPNFDSFVQRLPLILEFFVRNGLDNFEVIIPFFVISFITFKSKNFILLASVIMPIAAYYGFMVLVYLSSTVDFEWHLATSFERLFHQIIYMYIFGGVFLLFYYFSNKNNVNTDPK